MAELELKKRRHRHFDLTPLIDIVFNLLLFFVLSYQLNTESRIEVALPRSETAAAYAKNPEVRVDASGAVFFAGRRTGLPALRAALAPLARGGAAVNVKADKRAGLGVVVSVVDEIKAAGFDSFNIITER
jgi:biopolymer transport protein ExbD